jgi:hypothetical protein
MSYGQLAASSAQAKPMRDEWKLYEATLSAGTFVSTVECAIGVKDLASVKNSAVRGLAAARTGNASSIRCSHHAALATSGSSKTIQVGWAPQTMPNSR